MNTFKETPSSHNTSNQFDSASLRYARPSSLYLPPEGHQPTSNNDVGDGDESQNHLLSSGHHHHANNTDNDAHLMPFPDPPPPARLCSQTLGRLNRSSVNGNHDKSANNPLFDSLGSLDQPWFRTFGHATSRQRMPHEGGGPSSVNQITGPPRSNHQPPDDDELLRRPELDLPPTQPSIRVPLPPRSPANSMISRRPPPSHTAGSMRSSLPPLRPASSGQPAGCLPCCLAPSQADPDLGHYSSPEPLLAPSDRDWSSSRPTLVERQARPWILCALTVGAVCDLLMLIAIGVAVFFLNCSPEGAAYQNSSVKAVCKSMWSSWVPMHRRPFYCPADSRMYQNLLANLNYRYQQQPGQPPYNPSGQQQQPPYNPANQQPPLYPQQQQPNQQFYPQLPLTRDEQVKSSNWDADLGLMLPPSLLAIWQANEEVRRQQLNRPDQLDPYDPRVRWPSRVYQSASERQSGLFYAMFSRDGLIAGCLVIPVLVILIIEFTGPCLACYKTYASTRSTSSFGKLRRVLDRVYRFSVTYILGFLTALFVVLLLKVFIGRLRPNFIQTCQPSRFSCPYWALMLQASGLENPKLPELAPPSGGGYQPGQYYNLAYQGQLPPYNSQQQPGQQFTYTDSMGQPRVWTGYDQRQPNLPAYQQGQPGQLVNPQPQTSNFIANQQHDQAQMSPDNGRHQPVAMTQPSPRHQPIGSPGQPIFMTPQQPIRSPRDNNRQPPIVMAQQQPPPPFNRPPYDPLRPITNDPQQPPPLRQQQPLIPDHEAARRHGLLTDVDCRERDELKMKDARSSFPSLSATISMYTTIFLTIYISNALNLFRRTCFCIPFTLLFGSCLLNLLIGIGLVVRRFNWMADVVAGWLLGIIMASYILYRMLCRKEEGKRAFKRNVVRKLDMLYSLARLNNEYKQSELKFMKYM